MRQEWQIEIAIRNLMGALSIGEIMQNKILIHAFEEASNYFGHKRAGSIDELKSHAESIASLVSAAELRANPQTQNHVTHIRKLIR